MASSADNNIGPGTPGRKSRKSWFDTPPLVSLDPKPIQNENIRPSKSKRRSIDTMEILTLTHFTAAPRLGFATAVVGSTKFRTLLIRNPHDYEQEVIIEKFPFKKKFCVEHTRFIVDGGDAFKLEITWTPEEAGGVREMILLHVDGVYRLQCYLFGTAEMPKAAKKTFKRSRLGPRVGVNQNTIVIPTPALNRIKSSYSPRRSQDLRELQALVESKEHHHNEVVKSQDEVMKAPSYIKHTIKSSKEFMATSYCQYNENRENVRPNPIALTPTPLESTSLGSTIIKNDEESSSEGRRQWKKIPDHLSSHSVSMAMSPIPMSDGNENGMMLEDSYFRHSEMGVTKLLGSTTNEKMKDTFVVPNDARSYVPVHPKQEIINKVCPGMSRQLSSTIIEPKEEMAHNVTTVLSAPKSEILKTAMNNESKAVSSLIMECNKRMDWSSPKHSNSPIETGQSPVSPNTMLDRSISLITQVSAPNENEILTHHDLNASVNNNSLISQGKGFVSPNSFMEDMKGMRYSKNTNNGDLSLSDTMVLSPSSVMNNSIPHHLMIEHLANVSRSLNNSLNSPIAQNFRSAPKGKLKRRSLTTAYRTAERKKVMEVRKSPNTIMSRNNGRTCYLSSITDSPRRETFVVNKKGRSSKRSPIKRNSPLKKQKMVYKSDRSRKSPLNKFKNRGKHFTGLGAPFSPRLSKMGLLGLSCTPIKQSPSVIDCVTVVKNKSYTDIGSPVPVQDSEDRNTAVSPKFASMSPSCLPMQPDEQEQFSRRGTLTVTKPRPSDALLSAMNNNRKRLFDQAVHQPTHFDKESSENEKMIKTVEDRHKSGLSPVQFYSPTFLPTSPKPQNSRRSTHVVKSPKVLDLSSMQQKCLNFDVSDMHGEQLNSMSSELQRKEESYKPITAICLRSPLVVDYEITSEDSSEQSISIDSLETSGRDKPADSNDDTSIRDSWIECENRIDVKFDVCEEEITASSIKPMMNHDMDWSYCEKGEETTHPQGNIEGEKPATQFTDFGSLCDESNEKYVADSAETSQQEQKFKRRLRRSVSANEILSTVFNIDVSEFQSEVANCTTTKNESYTNFSKPIAMKVKHQKRNNCQSSVLSKNCPTMAQNTDAKAMSESRLHSNTIVKTRSGGNLNTLRPMSRSLTNMAKNSCDVGKKGTRSNEEKTAPIIKKKTVAASKTAGPSKPRTVPAKGVAQSKLILIKKPKSAVARHPMPFAARNMYYDERWMLKQEKGFVQWLNFVLTPPDEYIAATSKPKVDAAALTLGNQHVSARLAPTKEVLSFRAYAARRRLNRLRRAACQLYQSDGVVTVIRKVEVEVESRRIAVRKEKMVHADLGIKQNLLDLLLQYSSLWLRIGLETIFGEVLMLQSNTDVLGLSRYIVTRLLGCPDIAAQYAHPSVPHLYSEGYAAALSRHTVKKFLLLVYFLDKAKSSRLIDHDPCLFCKDADIKSSKEILIQFSRQVLSGEGDVTRHLAYLGYAVSQVQRSIDEFDYAVTSLSNDLKDGLRLSRILELLGEDCEIMYKLRTPAISRLQKIHNMESFFSRMSKRGMKLEDVSGTTARDVVDGHREKTLALLWHLILHFQANVSGDEMKLKEEIHLLTKSLQLKLAMQSISTVVAEDCQARRDSGESNSFLNDERMQLIFRWCRLVCLHYGVKVENMTVSFSDGRALCCLLHHYHPALLPLSEIKFQTTIRFQEVAEDLCDGEDLDLSVDWGKKGGMCQQEDDPAVFEQLLANEKHNFKVLYDKVSALGGVPLMVRHSSMSNTIPDEKVVTTYVSYLCSRLLDIREEVRAARVIQMAWRRWRLQKTFKQRQREIAAAVIIQRQWRILLGDRLAVRKEVERTRAAILIQNYYRTHKCRQEYCKTRKAVMCLQALWRMRQAKVVLESLRTERRQQASEIVYRTVIAFYHYRHYQKVRQSIITIQSFWRMVSAKKELEVLKFVRNEKAATCIQRNFKAYVERKHFLQTKVSVLAIQTAWRCYIVKKMKRLHFERKEKAAITMQAFMKGSLQRQKFLQMKNAAIVVQKTFKMKRAVEKLRQLKIEKTCTYATIIQKNWRCYQGHKLYNEKRRLAIFVQAQYRMTKARRNYCQMKESAVKIQSFYRNTVVARQLREEFLQQKAAAILIQSAVRSSKVKKDFQNKQKAAVTLQKYFRSSKQRKEFCAIKCAAVTIQRAFRNVQAMKRIREDYLAMKTAAAVLQQFYENRLRLQKNHAAIVIQTALRRFRVQSEYKRRRRACLMIQKWYRNVKTMRAERLLFLYYKCSAIIIQSRFRVNAARKTFRERRNAVIKIQSFFRMVSVQEQFHQKKNAAMIIQMHYRAWKMGKIIREAFVTMRNASTVIQRFYRREKCRRARAEQICLRNLSASKLQACFKCVKERKKYVVLKAATLTLQRKWRAIQKGTMVRHEIQVQNKAVVTIQTAWKSFVTIREAKLILSNKITEARRLEELKKNNAAVIIQRTWNQFILIQEAKSILTDKREAKRIKEEERCREEEKQNAAAIFIQHAWKNFTVIRDAQILLEIKRELRIIEEGRIREELEISAALVIQHAWKHFKVIQEAKMILENKRKERRFEEERAETERKREKERQTLAAAVIQHSWRGFKVIIKSKMVLERLREEKRLEEEKKRQNSAAFIVQNAWKTYITIRKAKMMLERKREERRVDEKRRWEERLQNSAAIVIQQAWKNMLIIGEAKMILERLRDEKTIEVERREVERRQEQQRQIAAAIVMQHTWWGIKAIREAKMILKVKREERRMEQDKLEAASSVIQCVWRNYLAVQDAKTILQCKREAKRIEEEENRRKVQERQNNAASVIQSGWKMFLRICEAKSVLSKRREEKRIEEERMRDEERKNAAAFVLQNAWRSLMVIREAKIVLESKRQEIRIIEEENRRKVQERQNNAASVIQSGWKMFLRIREAKSVLSKRREEKRIEEERMREEERKNAAAFVLQNAWRSLMVIREAKIVLESKRQEIRIIEEERRANELRNNAAFVIQHAWKKFAVIREAKMVLQNKKKERRKQACATIQRAWKQLKQVREGKIILEKKGEVKREEEKRAKAAAVLLHQHMAAVKCQAWYRMLVHRHKYLAIRSAILFIQRKFRAVQAGNEVRMEIHKKHVSAMTIQMAWGRMKLVGEAKSILEKLREEERQKEHERQKKEEKRKLMERVYEETHVKAALTLQKYAQSFLHRLHERRREAAVIVLQKYVRRFICRCQYNRTVHAVIFLQRRARMVAQWRRYQEMKREKAATIIQALWRGVIVRRNTTKKLRQARQRLEKANRSANDKNTLGSRTWLALDYLLNNTDMSHILEALMHLEVATRLSPVCCERLVEAGGVVTLIQLLTSCNRSIPHMEIIRHTIDILLNLAKYDRTVDNLLSIPKVTGAVLEVMQIYRDKGVLFYKSCALFGILARDVCRRQVMLQCPSICDRLQSIHSLVIRKNHAEVKRQNTKAKFGAMKSFNCTLPVATPTKLKQKQIRPEWILRKDNAKEFTDPLTAVNFVMRSFQLNPK